MLLSSGRPKKSRVNCSSRVLSLFVFGLICSGKLSNARRTISKIRSSAFLSCAVIAAVMPGVHSASSSNSSAYSVVMPCCLAFSILLYLWLPLLYMCVCCIWFGLNVINWPAFVLILYRCVIRQAFWLSFCSKLLCGVVFIFF